MNRLNANRRRFLAGSLTASAGLAIGGAMPGPWMHALANKVAGGSDRILIVIQLSGGNDGLNTVIPYADEAYQRARPKLAIPISDVRKFDDRVGLHPSLGGVEKMLESGRFSIVQGVGYSAPNRSHFESMDIWHSCHRKAERGTEGWLGRWIAAQSTAMPGDSLGLHLGSDQQPLALAGRGVQVPSIASIERFRLKVADDGLVDQSEIETRDAGNAADATGGELLGFLSASTAAAADASARIEKALETPDAAGDFPDTQLGEKLRVISRLIVAGLSTKVYYVTLDGFDTHSQQPQAHAALLRQWSDALESLVRRLEQAGQADRVLVMTFSEFGRRVAENASDGTDHGAAAPMFLSGPRLPKAVFGDFPSLTDLEDGDLKFTTDFRSVYATVIEKWFQTASQPILGEAFPTIDVI